MTTTPREATPRKTSSNGAAQHILPTETVKTAVTDLAHSLRDTADKRSKLAKLQARKLYRKSSTRIKHNPWRAVGVALLTGILAGGLLMMSRRTGYTTPAESSD